VRFEFPPRRPDQALLGCRRGQVKNKIKDPAAIIHPRDRMGTSETISNFGFKLLKNKQLLVPGRGIQITAKQLISFRRKLEWSAGSPIVTPAESLLSMDASGQSGG